jgi:DNA-binding response OmpR family regulator
MAEGKNILIIDDEEDLCLLLTKYLQRQGATADYALNLQDGILKLIQWQPDLLLLDNNLPDGTGIDRIDDIRERHYHGRLIVMSAIGNLREKALKAGAESFLEKPVSFRAIHDLL